MPLDEDGAKWSCEPCIRGHRSSKCQHFDRLMMKVPKAGRPLAKCPHPKGTCSCQKVYAFMVRIPKGSSCVCRPLYKIPADAKENGHTPQLPPTIPNLPGPIPGPSSASSIRVQKRGKRQNSTRSISDNSMKSFPNLSAMQTAYTTMPPAVNFYSNLNLPHNPPSSTSGTATSAYQKPVSCCSNKNVSTPPSVPTNNQLSTDTQSSTQNENRACCSRKQSAEVILQTSTSCCSKTNGSKTERQSDGHANIKEEENDPAQGPPSITSHFTHPTSFLAAGTPAHLGSFNNVPQQANGLQFQGGHISNSVSAPVSSYSSPTIQPQYAALNQIPTAQYFPNTPGIYPQDYLTIPEDVSHNCGCGPGCQCLGCASHPFNETTRQHIQEMGYLMASRADDLSAESPRDSAHSPPNDQQYPYDNQGYSNLSMNDVASLDQGYGNPYEHFANIPGTTPLATPLQPSDNQGQGQMMMQPNAYVTVEYPVGLLDPCTNMTGTCQCGANCACVGCITHHGHNGVPLQPSPPPENSEFPMQNIGLPASHGSPIPQHEMSMYTAGANGNSAHPHWGGSGG